MHRPLGFLTLGVSLLAAAACGDAAAPNEFPGQYRLARLNGEPVPAPQGICGIPVNSGSLLVGNGQATRTVETQFNGAPHNSTGTGPVTRSGSTVQFAFNTDGSVWAVSGTWTPGRIVISYPAPCDGTVLEEFDRE